MFGGAEVVVDGEPVHLPDTMAYKGMMLSGVPNLVYMIGYTNASWTLKVDLVAEYVVRLLRHLRDHGLGVAVPERDPDVEEAPFLDFGAGYVQRSIDELPKQGTRAPWRLAMNYAIDAVALRRSRVDDDAIRFVPVAGRSAAGGRARGGMIAGMTTVGVVAPGAMGTALGRCLAEGGHRVLTSLAGRSEDTAARAHGVFEDAGGLEDLVRAVDVVLLVVPPGAARAAGDPSPRRARPPAPGP